MIRFLFPGQKIPSWMFDVVEAPNTLVPVISCFAICVRIKGVVHVLQLGNHLIKVKPVEGKTICRMRLKIDMKFHFISPVGGDGICCLELAPPI